MHSIIRTVAYIIILLGVVHISLTFPLHMNTDTLSFVGAGMAIIFAGLLNLVAIDRSGSKFTKAIAVIVNAFNCMLFCFAVPILNEPQVYIGIAIFLITTVAFTVDLLNTRAAYENAKNHSGITCSGY